MGVRKRVLVWLAAVASAAIGSFGAAGHAAAGDRERIIRLIDHHRAATWRWQKLMAVPLTPTRYWERRGGDAFLRDALETWRMRAGGARQRAYDPPRHSAWLCIHRHEGPWTANTGNGYYGGLQMDLTFQRMYGRFLLRKKGLAHRWLPIEQIWVAERAYRSGRGFHPWPNTARSCGLL